MKKEILKQQNLPVEASRFSNALIKTNELTDCSLIPKQEKDKIKCPLVNKLVSVLIIQDRIIAMQDEYIDELTRPMFSIAGGNHEIL